MKKNMQQELLNLFGAALMEEVRDDMVDSKLRAIKGEMKSKISISIAQRLKELSAEQLSAVEDLIITSVDGALNNFLWMIEQHEEFDLVAIKDGQTYSLRDASDGLSVDYWNFVESYSNYKNPYESTTGDLDEDPKTSITEELIAYFNKSDEKGARAYLVRVFNNEITFAELKANIETIPLNILEWLVQLMLAKSEYHRKECEELLRLRKKNLYVV